MLGTKLVSGQAPRNSRFEGKQSFLPRRLGSTDRLSDARRPSGSGLRSSSAEAPRVTITNRLSREASATKLSLNRRSKSQQGESRYGQSATTPLRGSHYLRPTTTPVRTPSGDRSTRSWEASLDRALACLTVKDQRPLSNVAWQRSELARVQEALAARGAADTCGGNMTLIRPLTIARFVDITGELLNIITRDAKLNNDNYVTKLPHVCKRLLYPGTVSKSWLKTVNTLHAFPNALALIAYLLDLLNRIESPVADELLYVMKDDLNCLRREYLYKCWIRFQDPDPQFDDLTEEYLQLLKQLLGTNEDKIIELQKSIKQHELALEDEAEKAARLDEQRRCDRRDQVLSSLRDIRATTLNVRAARDQDRATVRDHTNELNALEDETNRATAEMAQLRRELEEQNMTVAERSRLQDEVDYAARVLVSKRELAEQISKMVVSKERELGQWQKKTLDSCVEYKQGLIHLSGQFPDLAALAIDETQLMDPHCNAKATAAVEALRQHAAKLNERRAQLTRTKSALSRKRQAKLEEVRTALADIKVTISREQKALDSEISKESTEASTWSSQEQELCAKIQALNAKQEEYVTVNNELLFWKKQDEAWRTKLAAMREYIREQREKVPTLLQAALKKRADLISADLDTWISQEDKNTINGIV